MQNEFRFPSTSSGVPVRVRVWNPVSRSPRAVVQISHGMVEHIDRYDAFARFLAANGFAVYGNDHLGHGGTARTPDDIGFFGDRGGWECLVEDMATLTKLARERHPGLPCFLYGHSMGSFLARSYAFRHPDIQLAGMLLTGTNFLPRITSMAGLALFSTARMLFGHRSRPVRLDRILFGNYNRPFEPARTPRDWLSRDESIVDAYMLDPLCGFVFTTSAYQELMRGLSEIVRQDRIRRMDPALPVWIGCGEFDTVGNCGEGARRTAEAFQAAGLAPPTLKVYPGARHELLNETCRDEVYGDICRWLESRLPVS